MYIILWRLYLWTKMAKKKDISVDWTDSASTYPCQLPFFPLYVYYFHFLCKKIVPALPLFVIASSFFCVSTIVARCYSCNSIFIRILGIFLQHIKKTKSATCCTRISILQCTQGAFSLLHRRTAPSINNIDHLYDLYEASVLFILYQKFETNISRNKTASFPISTFMYLGEIHIFPRSVLFEISFTLKAKKKWTTRINCFHLWTILFKIGYKKFLLDSLRPFIWSAGFVLQRTFCVSTVGVRKCRNPVQYGERSCLYVQQRLYSREHSHRRLKDAIWASDLLLLCLWLPPWIPATDNPIPSPRLLTLSEIIIRRKDRHDNQRRDLQLAVLLITILEIGGGIEEANTACRICVYIRIFSSLRQDPLTWSEPAIFGGFSARFLFAY